MAEISTKPYMLRAIHEWCTDSGLTPYIAVSVDENTLVPVDFVRAGEIVLNISSAATNRLEITNEFIQFQARFNGQAQELSIPVDNVSAIYARENGHGMAFEVASAAQSDDDDGDSAPRLVTADESEGMAGEAEEQQPVVPRGRPALTAVPVAGEDGNRSDDQPDGEGSDHNGADPDDDGPPPADNNNGPSRRPRGKPTLTRVK